MSKDSKAVTADNMTPQPPAAPRKRSRLSSPDSTQRPSNSGRRLVRSSSDEKGAPRPMKSTSEAWTAEEKKALKDAVMQYGERKRDWPKVGRVMAVYGRDKDACRNQWLTMRPPVKGSWTEAEDALLASIVTRVGARGWSNIAKHISGRNAKQCRERWVNHLDPAVNKTQWSAEEDAILVVAHKELGNKWSDIAKRLSGRPDNAVKNRWYTLQNRANGGGRKRSRARKQPSLASLLAKAAKVDLEGLDDGAKKDFTTLANKFSELAQGQLERSSGSSSDDTDGEDEPAAQAAPPKRPRRSFTRRSVTRAAAAAAQTLSMSVDDSLNLANMSIASDMLREVAIDIDQSMSLGLDSTSFASDLLSALTDSLDIDTRATPPPSDTEERAGATPSPTMPSPPTHPRNSFRRRTLAASSSAPKLFVPMPPMGPALTDSAQDLLAAIPLPVDDLSMADLSLSMADLSFFDAHPPVASPTTVNMMKLNATAPAAVMQAPIVDDSFDALPLLN